MEQETLFTASKWDILKLLSIQSLSPIELAQRSNTSVANVSQQLRLLEMAGLVKSERISNRDKGQPRVLYSLSGNHSYLISTSNDFVDKKFLPLSISNKIVMRIWFYHNPLLHYYLEKAFWQIDQHLQKIDAIAFKEDQAELTLLILSRDKTLKLPTITVNSNVPTRTVHFEVQHPDKISVEGSLYSLYDPGNILQEGEKNE